MHNFQLDEASEIVKALIQDHFHPTTELSALFDSKEKSCPTTRVDLEDSMEYAQFESISGTNNVSGVSIVANTLDLESLSFHDLHGSTVTPETLLESLETNDIYYHAWVAVKRVTEERANMNAEVLTRAAIEQFLVELGTAMLDFVPGPMFTFIDPRLYDNTAAMVRQAKSLVGRFEKFGVPRDRVVITIPATEQGIHAARDLVNNNSIYVNLTLVSGIVHSSACVEAGATVVTMSMSPLLEWFEQKRKTLGPATPHHPGVETLQTCISYLHLHDVKTKVVIADVRLLTELRQIHGLDAVLLSKGQLGRIRGRQVTTRIPDVTDKTPASLRASQAQYPTTFLQSKKGLMFTMSAETRSMVSAVLYVGIGKMKVYMEKIESTIRDELRWQIELDNMDLRKIYFREPETPQRKQVKHRESPKAADKGAHNGPATSAKPGRNCEKFMADNDECF